MISALSSTGHVELSMKQIGDMFDIDYRIKHGDESGWRGDMTMGIFVNPETEWFEVRGLDRNGNPYLAASHPTLDHTLLIKLRDGDPTKNDVHQRVLDHNAKVKLDQEYAQAQARGEGQEKMQWALRQAFGHLTGGRGGNLLATRKGKA